MTALQQFLQRHATMLADIARRYDNPADMTAAVPLHRLTEYADTVTTDHGVLLVLPADQWLLDRINDVLTVLAEAEDDDPGGDVLDRGETDDSDCEGDGTAALDEGI